MPRPLRYTAPGVVQHVIVRGNNKSVMFVDTADYRLFHETLASACADHGCDIHAYVFMTNHVHLLATPNELNAFAKAMQTIGRRYVRRFNDTYRRSGHLWGGRYKAIAINTEQYLFTCYRYIELNPVRAGLAAGPRDYPWSSHGANATGANDKLITPHERYTALGADPSARQTAYRALFSEELSKATLERIRESTNRGWALGSQRFRDEVAALLGRRTPPATRGHRPHRNDEMRV